MKVVFVVGPTASGKSAFAIKAAEKFKGAIINCDSVQVFKSLDIGSAKPSLEEFLKVPHFLFDYVPEGNEMTAGEYRRDFFETINKLKGHFPVVFVVGGTGFYFQAIEKGMYLIGAADEVIQAQVQQELSTEEGALQLYHELKAKDPEGAQRISPNDHYRLGRAIEILRKHGKSVTDVRREFESMNEPFPYPLMKLGMMGSREELEPRVQRRVEQMLEMGLIEEVRRLLERGLSAWTPMRSVGYIETVQYLDGKIDSESALKELIVRNTLKLAKKQRTWFQRDQEIFWMKLDQMELGLKKIENFLGISEVSP